MSDDHYEIRLQQVRERNKRIIGHFVHTWRGRISDDTMYQHVLNIEYFANGHLNYYADTADGLRSLDQVTGWKVYDFITDWLPRKGLVTSTRRVKSYLASFNKLFTIFLRKSSVFLFVNANTGGFYSLFQAKIGEFALGCKTSLDLAT